MKEERILKKLEAIKIELDNLTERIKKHKKKEESNERNALFHQNAVAVRYVSSLVARGVRRNDAVRLCAFKLNLDISKVNDLFVMYDNDEKYLNRRVNYLICKKLHKKGFSARKIADICGFSEKYVFKVLKKIIEN